MATISKFILSITQKYWLLLLIILALALRLFHLDQYGLWYDEAISYKAAQLDVRSILTNQIQSSHPPLYYLILHYWISFFPDSDFSARMLSVFWNIALIPIVYCLARELFKEKKVALIAVLLIAISPFHIAYSQELRMYTQLMFFTTSGVLVYLLAIKNNNVLLWTAFFLLFFLAIYTHYFAALVLIGIFIYEIIFRSNKKSFCVLTISCSILFALCIPWIYIILSQPDLTEGSLRPLFDGVNLQPSSLLIPFVNISSLIFGETYNVYLFFINFSITIVFFCYFFYYKRLEKQNVINKMNFLITISAVSIIIPSVLYYLFSLFFPHRSIATASPFILMMIGYFVARKKTIMWSLVYVSIILSIIGTLYYYTESNHNRFKAPNRELAHFFEKKYLYTDNILHTDDFSYIPLLRYLNVPNHARLAGSPRQSRPDSAYEPIAGQLWDIDDLNTKTGRLWLIVTALRAPEWQTEQKKYILQHANLIDEYFISGYGVYLLDLDGS